MSRSNDRVPSAPLNEIKTGLGIDSINSGIEARERFISRLSAFLDVDFRRANNDESNKPHPAIARPT